MSFFGKPFPRHATSWHVGKSECRSVFFQYWMAATCLFLRFGSDARPRACVSSSLPLYLRSDELGEFDGSVRPVT